MPGMARWRSGDAADCKSVYAGSIPARASIFLLPEMSNVGISQAPGGIFLSGALRGTYFGPGGAPGQFNFGSIVNDRS